ncbi:uncharacterized protein LOC109809414 [Cajanus cajan]|uniref:uncharacterized protein LOC109809414 n=1 Tax=Cajanus cajan TaxID=3821 RepID=UPI00098D91E7|nr:uncharacterized protein LOC109809414 [Cajanus cajan]
MFTKRKKKLLADITYSGARYPYVPTTLVVEISPSFAFPTSFANPKSEIFALKEASSKMLLVLISRWT